jgi:hypothetical protein
MLHHYYRDRFQSKMDDELVRFELPLKFHPAAV